ncbi:MAG: MFS transporter [Phycisphaerales bacterium]|nr:MFS transporter [Phycisphaerales bacterium]MDG2133438.1 MFS transporter [Phycisphaerales bacterium]
MTTATADATPLDGGPKIRLGIMMFLQYAVWGIWLPVLAIYLMAAKDEGGLGFSGGDVGWILGVAAASGALTAPFIAGQIADRFLNAEIALGALLLIGGVFNIGLAYVTEFAPFMLLSIAYSICYMPTIALTNSICFANLTDPDTAFPRVRVWGTVGWIVASTLFGLLYLNTNVSLTWMPWFFKGDPKPEATSLIANALIFSGVISMLYGLYAMILLPRTRPSKNSTHPLAFLEAFGLLRFRGVLILTIASLAISMIHNVYFVRTGPWLETIGFPKGDIGAVMSVGQIVEIFVLGVLGWFLKRLGFRLVITIGAIAYFLRFADFAWATDGGKNLAFIGIALHGFCFAFFFAAAFMFIDRAAPKEARHSAQTAFGIAILGVGPILSGFFNGWLDQVGATGDAVANLGSTTMWWREFLTNRLGIVYPDAGVGYPAIWWTLALVGALAAILVVVAFTDDSAKSASSGGPTED